MKKIRILCLLLLLPALACCREDDGEAVVRTFEFFEQDHGWSAGFTDYPVNFDPDIYELEHDHAELPQELGLEGRGLRIQGSNRSDDLFMFWKKQITGLEPDTEYSIVIEVDFATDAPAGAFGIGGPPGEALFVKVGASAVEPVAIEGEANGERYYLLNVDKGGQSEGGQNAVVVGDGAKPQNEEFGVYELKSLDNRDSPLTVTSDEDGNLWVFVGTDSGFEGKTVLYYTSVQVTLMK